MTPRAARRSPNGSLSPVGSSLMLNMPASESSLSASATALAIGVALGLHYIRAKRARNLAGQQFDSLHALELAAELVVEHDFRQLRNARLEADFPILVEEEPRILEPGPDDPLVAADDRARVVDAHIGDDEEFRQQLPVGGEQRKILLILPHGEGQAFLRHLEKRGVEFACVNGRQLDKRGDLFQ